KYEAIILASIVEKETGVGSERRHVAGVFINRLNKGMRLESDPTIIYGITGGEKLGRGLRRSEIDRKTDWNTYQIPGLPKTPICNPGRAALAAVLNPMETEDIFFVADGTGGHVFAKTLREHNNNVKKWRKVERQRKRAAQKRAREKAQEKKASDQKVSGQ
ncbi:MAG: endolytic transglycosylase MltG, partial [Robiginitomaculum sp.]|nr:endolytic transglycosylase MltG [Robiginitomaculum sp.]